MDQLVMVLEGLGLGKHVAAFQAADVDCDVLKLLTEDDLRELGLSLGHRRKLMAAIADGCLAPADTAAPAPLRHSGEQERRQITVVMCDLVGSTALTQRLDPETMSGIIQQFQNSVAGAISRFDGFVDRFMGDAVLAFFGYPRAHEDAAERAVRAALAIVAALGGITVPRGETLSVRIAVTSGTAMFGEIVEHDGVRQPIVTGEVVNLAARMQEMAPMNGVVIAARTRRLLRELFELVEMGTYDFKGIGRPVRVWSVAGERLAGTRFEATHGSALGPAMGPIVGREAEIAMLKDRWHSARDGEGQVVVLCGEAGMGKSRVALVLREHVANDGATVIRYQCSPYHRHSALHPAISQLQHAAGMLPDDPPEVLLHKLETLVGVDVPYAADAVLLLAALLSIPAPALPGASLNLSPDERKRRTLKVLLDQLLALSLQQPTLLLVEDAHWIDPTTLELLSQCIGQIQGFAVLMLITHRPEFQPNWPNLSYVTNMALSGLPRRQAVAIVTHLTVGKSLPPELLDQIIAKTDGIPLFVEELAKAILELGVLRDLGDRYELLSPLTTLAIPDTLHDSLLARLDRHPSTKELAQIGAVIGREFTHVHLSALAASKGDVLNAAIRELLLAGLVHQRGPAHQATYVFRHALIRDAAYSTLLIARRRLLHGQCADILLEVSPDLAERQPELLAHHLTEAGRAEAAIGYWLLAGRRAAERSANIEAVAHLRQGIALVPELADPAARSALELQLQLQVELGVPLIATEGYAAPATLAAWEHARALAEQCCDRRSLVRALYGLWAARMTMGETRVALGLADRILELAGRLQDDGVAIVGHRVRALTVHAMGDLAEARTELEAALALYDADQHAKLRFEFGQDTRVAATAILANVLWCQGYPDRAMRLSRCNVVHAEALGHANSLAYALAYGACLVAVLRGDKAMAMQLADRLIAVATEHRLVLWGSYGHAYKGWALAREGDVAAACQLLEEATVAMVRAGSGLYAPLMHGMMGYVLGLAGQHGEAMAQLSAAIVNARQREELWCLPELLRLQSREVRRLSNEAGGDEAERDEAGGEHGGSAALLAEALALAEAKGMRSWVLRVACDLAALWQEDGRGDDARALLRRVLEAMPEVSDTADRRRAAALLEGADRPKARHVPRGGAPSAA